MPYVFALAMTALFVAANVLLWSIKQGAISLFWESMAAAALAFPTLFWFVTRYTR